MSSKVIGNLRKEVDYLRKALEQTLGQLHAQRDNYAQATQRLYLTAVEAGAMRLAMEEVVRIEGHFPIITRALDGTAGQDILERLSQLDGQQELRAGVEESLERYNRGEEGADWALEAIS